MKNVSLKYKGDVKITIPSGLIPDNTNDILKNVKTGDAQFTDTVNFSENYSSYEYRFFKSSSQDVNVNDFTVVCGDVEAIPQNVILN